MASEKTLPEADRLRLVLPIESQTQAAPISRRGQGAGAIVVTVTVTVAILLGGGYALAASGHLPWRGVTLASTASEGTPDQAGVSPTPPLSAASDGPGAGRSPSPATGGENSVDEDSTANPGTPTPLGATTTGGWDAGALSLAPGGEVLINGAAISALPQQQAVARLTSVLGQPDEVTAVGQACDTHISIGYAVRWKNFRVLIQTQDDPQGGGNSRKGHIAGWDLNGWVADQLLPAPTMNGITIGSTLAQARLVYPDADEGEGDGTWQMWFSRGPDRFDDASLSFESNSPSARVQFADSGYSCGS